MEHVSSGRVSLCVDADTLSAIRKQMNEDIERRMWIAYYKKKLERLEGGQLGQSQQVPG